MSEDNNKIEPKLRFAEFKDSGEWEKILLIDVTDKNVKWSFIGGPFGSNLKASDYVSKGIRVIQLQNIGDGKFQNKYKIFTSIEKADELLSCNIYPGDIILSKMGDPVGRACLIPDIHSRYVMCSDGIRLVVDEQRHHKYFIYSLINSDQFRSLVEKTATGSTRKRIGLDELKEFPLTIPLNKGEQQKIAACLSSLDDLITAQSQKLQTLKTHKKGLMQQLFPAEGEMVPKLRFAEFSDSGEWEEKKLDEICKINPSINQLPKQFVYIDLESVENGILLQKKFINLEGAPSRAQRLLKVGDVIFQTVRPYQKNNYFFLPKDNLNYVASTGYAQLRAYESKMYLYQYIHNQIFVDKVLVKSTGTNYPAINSSDLAQIDIVIPNLPEQQKIASFLSSLDELITTQTAAIAVLRLHKKGLMQGLFPVRRQNL